MLGRIINSIKYRIGKINYKKISGFNNLIKLNGKISFSRILIEGSNNKVFFDKGSKLENLNLIIKGDNHHVHISSNCLIKRTVIWIEDNNCILEIGNSTTIESAHLAITENTRLQIGNDCMLANAVEIRTGDSHAIFDKSTNARINPAKDIYIGNHVWIGNNVTVLKGVTIEDGAIIGNNALVTKDVSSNTIVVGHENRIVKKNVEWTRER